MSDSTESWTPLEEAFEIVDISTISTDPAAPVSTYKSGGTNAIPDEVWQEGYTPPLPYIRNTTRNLQFNESDFIASPGEPVGTTSYITTSDGYTWAAMSDAINAMWPFNEADYAGSSPPILTPYAAGNLVVTPDDGVVKVTANFKAQRMKFYAEDPVTHDALDRYLIHDAWGNTYIMHASGELDQSQVAATFDAAVLPDGWTKEVIQLDQDLILDPAQGADGSYHYLVLRDSADNSYHQIGWGGAGMVSAQIEGMPIWGGQQADTLAGNAAWDDLLHGAGGNDLVSGAGGADTLWGDAGDDTLDGGDGDDTAGFSGTQADYRFAFDGSVLLVSGPDGTDRLSGVETLAFVDDAPLQVSSLQGSDQLEELVTLQSDGETTRLLPDVYAGPVDWLDYQLLTGDADDLAIGTSRNDFLALLGGEDAVDGGDGDDVLDGGAGSSFLTGGAGRDDFFLDGQSGLPTWTTITDWEAGERLSVWGWRPGTSQVAWRDHDGVAGWEGVTMHGDLDGDGAIDTSVTWTGLARDQLPMPLEFDGLLWFT